MALTATAQTQSTDFEAREALTTEIEKLARQVLAGYDDERLLGQRQDRTIVAVRRIVRERLPDATPILVGQVSRWRLDRLLKEHVGVEVRKHQGRVLKRRAEAEGGPAPEIELVLVEVINGVEHYEISARTTHVDNHTE